MKDFFAKCGCNCGHCPAFEGNARTDEDRQRCSDGWAKYLGARLRPDRISCKGCQSTEPWDTGNLLPDRGCNIRPCVVHNCVKTCAHCYIHPCEELKRRIPGEDFRELTEERIGAKMPEDDYVAFIKPYEGLKHLKEMRARLNPKAVVKPRKVNPLKAKIVEFPNNLSFSKKQIAVFKKLHNLFTVIISARADRFSRQILFKRRRQHILGLLWLTGLYGNIRNGKNPQLILDGRVHGSRKQCSWMVRKYDNTFHAFVRQGANMLHDYGVRWEFKPLKKGWLLKLSFKEKAGGRETLKTLKKYVVSLAEEYGEPVYAGNSRLKGNAFALFSKADMRVLSKN